MISLFDILNCGAKDDLRKQLTFNMKYRICMDVARIMFSFHSFNPPICHGHLTSHNVFFDLSMKDPSLLKKAKVKIGDIELLPILKYANTFYNYRSTSVWSAPEQLRQRKKLVEPTREMDVYSFGMLMWELWHETIPFDNDLRLCEKYVLNEDSRPMILSQKSVGEF